jgi:hypothetical protein
MKKNNNFTELKSNSKSHRVKVDLPNLLKDPNLREKKCDYHLSDRDQIQKAFLQKEFVNHLTMIFQEKNLEKQCVVLIQHSSKNING